MKNAPIRGRFERIVAWIRAYTSIQLWQGSANSSSVCCVWFLEQQPRLGRISFCTCPYFSYDSPDSGVLLLYMSCFLVQQPGLGRTSFYTCPDFSHNSSPDQGVHPSLHVLISRTTAPIRAYIHLSMSWFLAQQQPGLGRTPIHQSNIPPFTVFWILLKFC